MARKTSRKIASDESWNAKTGIFLLIKAYKVIFGNFGIFGLLWAIVTAGMAATIFVYSSMDTMMLLALLIVAFCWLATMYAVRRIEAGEAVSFREVVFNGMGPLISTMVVLAVIAIQMLPVALIPIVHAAAVKTEFLAEVWQVVVFGIIVVGLAAVSLVLLSGSLMALVTVSVPGMYPIMAMRTTYAMMKKKRLKFVLMMGMILLMLAMIWIVVMVPVIGISYVTSAEMWMTQPLVTIGVSVALGFSLIYTAVCLYEFYLKMINSAKSCDKI